MSTALAVQQDPRSEALLRAVGLDKVPAPQRELALAIAERYGLDLMLKHLVLVDGRPMITRDGLLHIAHRSGQFDGIEVSQPKLEGGYWHVAASVYRKDMSRPFTYYGRYPAQGGNAKYAPEMATKTAESHAFRRAFDISAPTVDEQWEEGTAVPTVERREPVPLAEKLAARRADIVARTDAPVTEPEPVVEGIDESAAPAPGEVADATPSASATSPDSSEQCESMSDPAMPPIERCRLFADHKGVHRAQGMSWPQK